jgi:hypothetical protein
VVKSGGGSSKIIKALQGCAKLCNPFQDPGEGGGEIRPESVPGFMPVKPIYAFFSEKKDCLFFGKGGGEILQVN